MITLAAKDDFWIVSVVVKIEDASGKVIEVGEATTADRRSEFWMYVATQENAVLRGSVVTITATDFAGNVVERV